MPIRLSPAYVSFLLTIQCHLSFYATKPSAEPHDAANGYASTADAVPQAITAHGKENGGETKAVSDNAEDALLGSVTAPSDSVAAENVCHFPCSNIDRLIREFFL